MPVRRRCAGRGRAADPRARAAARDLEVAPSAAASACRGSWRMRVRGPRLWPESSTPRKPPGGCLQKCRRSPLVRIVPRPAPRARPRSRSRPAHPTSAHTRAGRDTPVEYFERGLPLRAAPPGGDCLECHVKRPRCARWGHRTHSKTRDASVSSERTPSLGFALVPTGDRTSRSRQVDARRRREARSPPHRLSTRAVLGDCERIS